MARLDPSYISCGVWELNDLSEKTTNILEQVAREYRDPDDPEAYEYDDDAFAFLVFSDVEGSNGDVLAEHIRQERLGSLKESPARINPNSLNSIKVWVWAPDWDRLVREYG
jgi:hypothetical protein